MQVVHAQRNELVRNAAFGPALAGAYDFFGLSVLAPTDLSAYELRQWGAASDPREANRLMLRASIVNRAATRSRCRSCASRSRTASAARCGRATSARPTTCRAAAPRRCWSPASAPTRLIRIVDPGSEAVGFELDICLPADGGVRCANQIKTARQ